MAQAAQSVGDRPALNDVHQEQDDCYHQEDVKQPSQGVQRHRPQRPQHDRKTTSNRYDHECMRLASGGDPLPKQPNVIELRNYPMTQFSNYPIPECPYGLSF